MPYADVEWCEIDTEQIVNYDIDSETGYRLDVELEYPKELHDKRNDYPLTPELMKVTADLLSSHSEEMYKSYYSHAKTSRDEQTENNFESER